MKTINVIVAGCCGRMGGETVRAIAAEKDMQVVGAVDVHCVGEDVGLCNGMKKLGVPVVKTLAEASSGSGANVLVDFTTVDSAAARAKEAVKAGIRPVIGTTGFDAKAIRSLAALCEKQKTGALLAPNFAIGAVLMMKFAAEAAKHMPDVEIVELHHNRKLDYPSGTALRTADLIAEAREEKPAGAPDKVAKAPNARGALYKNIPVHSVRLPGLIADQEVIFGALGQTFVMRHSTTSREAFMPGVVLGVRRVLRLKGLAVGLETVI